MVRTDQTILAFGDIVETQYYMQHSDGHVYLAACEHGVIQQLKIIQYILAYKFFVS